MISASRTMRLAAARVLYGDCSEPATAPDGVNTTIMLKSIKMLLNDESLTIKGDCM